MFPLRDNIPTEGFPLVTVALIVLNVVAYLFWQKGGITFGDPAIGDSAGNLTHYGQTLFDYGAIPYELTHPGDHCEYAQSAGDLLCHGNVAPQPSTWITPFTAMFMHGGLLHLGGNMLFLWIFGNNVEDSMGPVRFVVFYLLGGLAALAGQILVGPDAAVPTLGASGAIAGVLGGYLVLFPRARVVTVVFIIFFFTILELPAMFFLVIWFAQQALFGYFDLLQPTGEGGGVAYFAHIGGFVLGLALVKLFADEARRRRQLERAR